jgi:hypothetical protein
LGSTKDQFKENQYKSLETKPKKKIRINPLSSFTPLQIKQMISHGRILINGKIIKSGNYKLRILDKIQVKGFIQKIKSPLSESCQQSGLENKNSGGHKLGPQYGLKAGPQASYFEFNLSRAQKKKNLTNKDKDYSSIELNKRKTITNLLKKSLKKQNTDFDTKKNLNLLNKAKNLNTSCNLETVNNFNDFRAPVIKKKRGFTSNLNNNACGSPSCSLSRKQTIVENSKI